MTQEVHNHGIDPSCPERLVGQCVLDAHQQAMQAAQDKIDVRDKHIDSLKDQVQALEARVRELENELRLVGPPYSPYSQAKVDELVRVGWDQAQRADRLQAEVERLKGVLNKITDRFEENQALKQQLAELRAENERLNAEWGLMNLAGVNDKAEIKNLIQRAQALEREVVLLTDQRNGYKEQREKLEARVRELEKPIPGRTHTLVHNQMLKQINERADRLAEEVDELTYSLNSFRGMFNKGAAKVAEDNATLTQQLADQRVELDKAWSVIEGSGVPKDRAKTIAGGIMVLQQRMNKESHDQRAEIERLKAAVEAKEHAINSWIHESNRWQQAVVNLSAEIVAQRAALDGLVKALGQGHWEHGYPVSDNTENEGVDWQWFRTDPEKIEEASRMPGFKVRYLVELDYEQARTALAQAKAALAEAEKK